MPIDPIKLGQLLDRNWPILVAWIGGERTDAEDVVQQAFIKLAQEEPVPNQCVAWLFTVSKRLAINQHISRQRRRAQERALAEFEAEFPTCSQTTEFEIRDLLAQLRKEEREVVIAKIWGGLSLQEIGTALNTSTATVWRHYQAGMNHLKELLGES